MTGPAILGICVLIYVVGLLVVRELLLWIVAFVVWTFERVRAR